MEALKQKILSEGHVLNGQVLKVDSFLNHQIDPIFMQHLGREMVRRFSDTQIDRILTIESSGIAIALAAAIVLNRPVVFARKNQSVLLDEPVYQAPVYSFTKKQQNQITVLQKFMPAGEQVLIIDDFLANGEAALGLCNLVRQAGSCVAGIGIVIEKAFQPGGAKLREAGYRVESLARIAALGSFGVKFTED